MSQFDFFKDIAKYGLENDQEKLLATLNQLIEHSKRTKKLNFALQLQSLLKDSIRNQKVSALTKHGSREYFDKVDDREINDLILDKATSSYRFSDLIASPEVTEELRLFVKEHEVGDLLRSFELPIANKLLLHGPSGCGKTLASFVMAGELNKMMVIINLGAIVSSKLGETSKNLAKIFRRAAAEDCIIFIDEFDSLGKVRDYNQDHGEMKRVVNTILQLFDYLPQSSIVIAATNQVDMLDDALLRRFDLTIKFDLPTEAQIKELVKLTLKNGRFQFDNPALLGHVIKSARGLSFYSIQKTLITAIKRSLFHQAKTSVPISSIVEINLWKRLLAAEKRSLQKSIKH
jgi:SpoVK/Ycf46/Vps4 family AAA+-type ATPase